MTIAMCYLSPEGVVLGADSTASINLPDGFHYFNHAQKLFRVGEAGSLGMLTWGLGGFRGESYRTLIAELADDIAANPPMDVAEVSDRWANLFWAAYSTHLAAEIAILQGLAVKPPFNPAVPDPAARTEQEESDFWALSQGMVVGFCIAGAIGADRRTRAFQIIFDPLSGIAPAPQEFTGSPFWGAPNMIQRLILGFDPALRAELLTSGKWTGTDAELDAIMNRQVLSHAILPIREAIDFVYTCIYSTIKALKFSSYTQICGGPIELAVITTDREFRWVRHKELDAAIYEGERP
jgi:hypothetical protein